MNSSSICVHLGAPMAKNHYFIKAIPAPSSWVKQAANTLKWVLLPVEPYCRPQQISRIIQSQLDIYDSLLCVSPRSCFRENALSHLPVTIAHAVGVSFSLTAFAQLPTTINLAATVRDFRDSHLIFSVS